ncbi:hypothetical protein D3C84_813350 [compost metagenome]
MQQVLGFREIVRSLMMAPKGMDLIALHQPLENEFFLNMLPRFPQSPNLEPLQADSSQAFTGRYRNGNAALWELFCEQQEQYAQEQQPAAQEIH